MKNITYIILSLIFLSSCTKENFYENNTTKESMTQRNESIFNSTAKFSKLEDFLHFESFEELDKFLLDASSYSHESLNAWENNLGFNSQRKTFYNAMKAEDVLNDQLEALPETEKILILQQGEYHSTVFNNALNQGILRYYTSALDNSSYWDYNIIDPYLAPAVNNEGLVKVGNWLVKYSNNEYIYVVKSGDRTKLSQAEAIRDNFENQEFKVIKTRDFDPEKYSNDEGDIEIRDFCVSEPHIIDYSKTNSWMYPTKRKRLKAWINGVSNANWGNKECVYGTQCTFQIRTQAQKKNFWGKWVYSINYGPSLTISNATWTYDASLMKTCTDYSKIFINFIPNGQFPKSPWTNYYPWTNNGFFNMHPSITGWWIFKEPYKYICSTINLIYYDIPVTYGGYGPDVWKLKRN